MKKSGKEISVKKAAQILNLSERTVLNFIKQKKLIAIKVGRDWFIDYASFISFSEKYEFDASANSENFRNEESFSEISENATQSIPKEKNEGEVQKKPLGLKNHLPSLRVYELAKKLLNEDLISLKSTSVLDERIQNLIFSTLEAIGSGFYSYSWDEKRFHYSRARGHAGGAMALIVCHEKTLGKWRSLNFELEESLLPALGALIKTVEKKAQKEKYEGRRGET